MLIIKWLKYWIKQKKHMAFILVMIKDNMEQSYKNHKNVNL